VSQKNVEVMRRALHAFNKRDGDTFGVLLAENAEIIPVRAALEGVTFRGGAAGAQYLAAADETWDDLQWEVDEIRDGDDWVLALGRIRGKGRDSGVAIDTRAGWVACFHAGLITRFETHSDYGKALKAVGLEE
jgi:ketosteroid isomerase-like protein